MFNTVSDQDCLQMSVRSVEVLKDEDIIPWDSGKETDCGRVELLLQFGTCREFMGAQGMSLAWLGNVGSFLSSLFSFEALASFCAGEFAP